MANIKHGRTNKLIQARLTERQWNYILELCEGDEGLDRRAELLFDNAASKRAARVAVGTLKLTVEAKRDQPVDRGEQAPVFRSGKGK